MVTSRCRDLRNGAAAGRSLAVESHSVEDVGILDAIGRTPIVRLRRVVPRSRAGLWIKLEYRNPSSCRPGRSS